MNSMLRILLTDLIDYAGLFPPACADMAATVQNFAGYSRGKHGWMLARLVVPMARLAEFETASRDLLPRQPDAPPWRLTALPGSDLDDDLEAVLDFNQSHAGPGQGLACIDSFEIKAASPQQIGKALERLPDSIQPYFEIPLDDRMESSIEALSGTRGRAKIRMGGITPESIPASSAAALFLVLCAERKVSLKATAGLHHPVRGEQRLTYDADPPRAEMHGFLNFFLAAGRARSHPEDPGPVAEILRERDSSAFHFGENAVQWRDHRFDRSSIEKGREFAVSFGSCSFEEPVEDLRKLGLL